MTKRRLPGRVGILLGVLAGALAVGGLNAGAPCPPFVDVAADAFCPFVQEVFYLGITTGTTPTTYDPTGNVTRLQMAAFLSRTVDGVLKRGSRRAALNQFWNPHTPSDLGITTMTFQGADYAAANGLSVWVSGTFGNSVTQVLAGTGGLFGTWTGATQAKGVLIARGQTFVAGATSPGRLYMINPQAAAGAVTTVATNLGDGALALAYNGARILSANTSGSVSVVVPTASIPWTVTTVTTGYTSPTGILFAGDTFWVTDQGAGKLLRVGSIGNVLQTVTVQALPFQSVFDGTNIWVPNFGSDTVTVVRAFNGAVLQTLTAVGLSGPKVAAFDGERVL
ncbi:MAG TPA: S-layer homology domain-containing protein, partial [Thermoanaerobaculia bacterium]|nr:S-layer homology domain-containing protein [Thermoanaerobaculia bacterium]